ncbi:MAG: hypothetical protein FJ100_09305 [Deltaproteobacteria bacterium]|nr:hypothetical protein [Deltaproteobacteria bacterium]
MDAAVRLAFEAVAVEQRQEQVEIGFVAIVGRGRHQQEVGAVARQQLTKVVAVRVLGLPAIEVRRHLVRFVANNQVPGRRSLQLALQILVAN